MALVPCGGGGGGDGHLLVGRFRRLWGLRLRSTLSPGWGRGTGLSIPLRAHLDAIAGPSPPPLIRLLHSSPHHRLPHRQIPPLAGSRRGTSRRKVPLLLQALDFSLTHAGTRTPFSLSLSLSLVRRGGARRREMAANAAALSSVTCQKRFLSPPAPPVVSLAESRASVSVSSKVFSVSSLPVSPRGSCQHNRRKRSHLSKRTSRSGAGSGRGWAVASVALEDLDVIPVRSGDATDQQEGLASVGAQEEDVISGNNRVGGFAFEGGATSFGDVGVGFSSSPASSSSSLPPVVAEELNGEALDRMVDRAINATIVLAAGTAAITKLLTIDHDYWHGWTLYEILRYAPQHNWIAYEEALKTNPVLAKMMISGIVYSLGDWIAQCYEGKPLFEFDRARMFRSGLVGFTLHGSLSHYYYHFCEALFPFQDWWVVPAKVVFDQTVWSAVWNSIYYVVLGFLRLEPPGNILGELQATFWPMLKAGWKLWPFAHLITYGVIPVEQRLLWVDCVELVWVTILSTYSNEKSEARNSESLPETKAKSS